MVESSFYPWLTPSELTHGLLFHLLSFLAGILMCKIVYSITGYFSSFFFKESYSNLTKSQKVEWDNRGFSTFHAFFSAAASMYLLAFSDLFQDDSHVETIIHRNSVISNTILGISIGYFLSDLGMIIWHFPALGGNEYILHHGLSMFAIFLSLMSGSGQIYILMVLFSEVTTPFVNLRWYLDTAGQKNSKLYIYNGIALFLGWLVARILLFIYFFYHMFLHFDQVKTIFPLGFYSLLTVPPALALMNVFWFWKIVKGLIKTVSRSRRHKD